MENSLNINLKQEQKLSIKQLKSLEILALNQQDLELSLNKEVEKNPILEFTEESKSIYHDNKKIDFFFESLTKEESLQENLLLQLNEFTNLDTDSKNIIEEIIFNIGDNGYLAIPLEQLQQRNKYNSDKIQQTLIFFQDNFLPIGIGARSMSECLQIQLRKKNKIDSIAYKIVSKQLDLLKKNNIPQISKNLNISINDVYCGLEYIKSLHPYPALNQGTSNYIKADVDISIADNDELIVSCSKMNVDVKISSYYVRLLETDIDQSTKKYVNQKIDEAKTLIASLDKRLRTIQKLTIFIAEYHKDFFLKKSEKIKPLLGKDVAKALNIHESTISRAISNKYIQSPKGLLPFKFFFNNEYKSIELSDDSMNIKESIATMIAQEDQYNPLSDNDIMQKLLKNNITIARRTIAKYREELGILSSKLRKKY